MKKVHLIAIILGLGVLPLFQNCGMGGGNTQASALYVGEKSPDCLATVVDCGPKPEYLEITIDLTNPSQFPKTNSTFVVYGRCNTGNYENSAIRYLVYAATNLDTPISDVTVSNTSGYSYGYCKNGKYYKEIDIGSGFSDNTAYVLTVQMLAFDPDTGQPIQNLQSNGSANIDFSKQ